MMPAIEKVTLTTQEYNKMAKEICDLTDTIRRRNLQIKDLKKVIKEQEGYLKELHTFCQTQLCENCDSGYMKLMEA